MRQVFWHHTLSLGDPAEASALALASGHGSALCIQSHLEAFSATCMLLVMTLLLLSPCDATVSAVNVLCTQRAVRLSAEAPNFDQEALVVLQPCLVAATGQTSPDTFEAVLDFSPGLTKAVESLTGLDFWQAAIALQINYATVFSTWSFRQW